MVIVRLAIGVAILFLGIEEQQIVSNDLRYVALLTFLVVV